MNPSNNLQVEIATILRKIGGKKCLAAAERLNNESAALTSLHLRNLGLKPSAIASIITCIAQMEGHKNFHLKSISFSYNHRFGDDSAAFLAKNLPRSIGEIGLVNCGIGDVGGNAILQWMEHAPDLKMICMEENNFSNELKLGFKKFSDAHPQVLVVY